MSTNPLMTVTEAAIAEAAVAEPALQQAPLFTEAPGVVFTKLFGTIEGQVVEFNITCRAGDPTEAIRQLMDAAKFAKETYKLSLVRPDLQKAPSAGPAGAPAAGKPAPAAPSNNNGNGSVNGVIHATRLKIVPEEGDKVSLQWFAPGHEFPDIQSKRGTAKALELLQSSGEAWEENHLARVGSFNVKHAIYWRASEKLNPKGNPYKDIVEIRAE
jgi:hypothetical protein